jgi:hypothetical protein
MPAVPPLPPPVHTLFWQVCPAPHGLPQAPQFVTLDVTSAHCPPQTCWPATGQMHVPPEQERPAGQALLQPPQWATAVIVFTQAAPHAMSVALHSLVQEPAEQNKPGAQAFPHMPQFWGSYEVSVQV